MTLQAMRHQNRSNLFVEVDCLSLQWRKTATGNAGDDGKCTKLEAYPGYLCHDKSSLRTRDAASMHHWPTSGNRFWGSRLVGDITVIAPTGR